MHILKLQGPPACEADLLFKFPLHFADLSIARVLIYDVHITHIELSLGSPFPMHACTLGRKSVVAAGGMDCGARSPPWGVKSRGEHPQSPLECGSVWTPQFQGICPCPFHQPQKNQGNMGRTEEAKPSKEGIAERDHLLLVGKKFTFLLPETNSTGCRRARL